MSIDSRVQPKRKNKRTEVCPQCPDSQHSDNERHPYLAHKNIDWRQRYQIPVVTGKRAEYLTLYRQWLDQSDPHHHLWLVTDKNDYRFVRLYIIRKQLNICIQEQFVYNAHQTIDEAYNLAIQQRNTLPDELFCMVKRLEPEVPGVYFYPTIGYKGDITSGGKRQYRCFSFARYKKSEAYALAVKSVFDAKGVTYPKHLFKEMEDVTA